MKLAAMGERLRARQEVIRAELEAEEFRLSQELRKRADKFWKKVAERQVIDRRENLSNWPGRAR